MPSEVNANLQKHRDLKSSSGKCKYLSKLVVLSDFNEPTILNNDIGLVRLESEVAFTKFINPLCLPALGETGFGTSAYGDGSSSTLDTTGLQIVGKNSTVIGWGMVNDGEKNLLNY